MHMHQKSFLLAFSLLLGAAGSSFGQDKGLDIAKAADKRDEGFVNTQVNLKMVLKNKYGQESTRTMTNKTLEVTGDGDKSVISFNSPKDVKGTSSMTYTHKVGPDDQWLYLPAVKRVKRISSNNKSGPFMGSEFAFEDLSSQEVEKYTYKYLADETYEGQACFKVERDPVDPKSGYTRQVVWYNKDNYRLEKIEFYDRKNAHLKTLTYHNYKLYLGKFWRAQEMQMVNHQSGKETKLIFENYTFKSDAISEDDFTQNSLRRAG
ncbi:MAG: outer membrane lipoprotein-sorting protein [Bacteroidota bacterium]